MVQCFINNYGDKLDIMKLFENDAHLRLSCAPFGNYVIQCIIKQGNGTGSGSSCWYSKLKTFINFKNKFITSVFKNRKDIIRLSDNKFGSNVMEKCIIASNKAQLNLLISSICWNRRSGLRSMIPNEYANYVLSTLLIYCDKTQQESIVNCVHNQIADLYDPYLTENFQFGWEFLLKCQEIKYSMDERYN